MEGSGGGGDGGTPPPTGLTPDDVARALLVTMGIGVGGQAASSGGDALLQEPEPEAEAEGTAAAAATHITPQATPRNTGVEAPSAAPGAPGAGNPFLRGLARLQQGVEGIGGDPIRMSSQPFGS